MDGGVECVRSGGVLADGPVVRDERRPEDYAIEFGEYLAKAAGAYVLAVNDHIVAVIDGDADDNGAALCDAHKGLASAIYEFRKRAARCVRA